MPDQCQVLAQREDSLTTLHGVLSFLLRSTMLNAALAKHLMKRYLLFCLMILTGVLWYSARYQFAHMDRVFFQGSLTGAKGLGLYVLGQYGPSARAYRIHFQEHLMNKGAANDNADDTLLRGDIQGAKRRAKLVLQREQHNVPALLDLAEVFIYEGNYSGSRECLDSILGVKSDEPNALLLSSILFARIGKYDHAIDSLNQVLRSSQVASRLTIFLNFLETAGDLAAIPSDKRPYSLLALYYRYLRVYDDSNGQLALVAAKAAIKASDRPADAYLTIGVVYDKRGDKQQALEAFQKAVEANPRYALAYWWAAGAYGNRGDLLNEYRMAKAAFESSPEDPFYITHLDHVLLEKLGDAGEAVTMLEKAVQLNPRNAEAFDRLGYAYGFMGDGRRSVDAYRKALALDSTRLGVYLDMARSLAYLGKTEEAAHTLRLAAEVAPRNPSPHLHLARLYVDQLHLREAVAEFETAFSLGLNDNSEQSELCALYHFEIADYQRAVTCFREVLARDPSDQRASRMLPEALQNLRLEQAKR